MGLFSKLKKIANNTVAHRVVNGLTGNKPKDQVQAAAPADAAADPYDEAAAYAGDTSDPAYGSFTDPFTVEDFYDYADPGYGFQLQQGQQALLNQASAGSGSMSGAAFKDLLKYNQDYAGTAYNDAFNRYQTQQGNIYSRLFNLTQLGQNAAAGVGSQGTALAGNAGTGYSNAGSALGGGIVGAGNSLSDATTNYWLMKSMQKG
jgi:hypothetical protein